MIVCFCKVRNFIRILSHSNENIEMLMVKKKLMHLDKIELRLVGVFILLQLTVQYIVELKLNFNELSI